MAWMTRIVTVAVVLCCIAAPAHAALAVRNLQVEYRSTPLGIDAQQPRFGWQLQATSGERGVAQSAYRIEVRDPKGAVVWDSRKTDSPESLAITYGGSRLEAATRYV